MMICCFPLCYLHQSIQSSFFASIGHREDSAITSSPTKTNSVGLGWITEQRSTTSNSSDQRVQSRGEEAIGVCVIIQQKRINRPITARCYFLVFFSGPTSKPIEREASLCDLDCGDFCEITGSSLPNTNIQWNFEYGYDVNQEGAHHQEEAQRSECTMQMDYPNSLAGVRHAPHDDLTHHNSFDLQEKKMTPRMTISTEQVRWMIQLIPMVCMCTTIDCFICFINRKRYSFGCQ